MKTIVKIHEYKNSFITDTILEHYINVKDVLYITFSLEFLSLTFKNNTVIIIKNNHDDFVDDCEIAIATFEKINQIKKQ
jgi:hypothetical protein